MSKGEEKIRIAIIIPGGIGTGHNNIGVPVMERLIKLLVRDFQITVFSLFKINKDYIPLGFEIISIDSPNRFVRFVTFFSIFIRENRKKKFQIVHGFWALPSGLLAVLVGKFLRIKSVVSVLGGDAIALPQINYGQLQRWLPRKLVLLTLGHSNEVICLTHYLVNNLKSTGLKREGLKVMPWGVDTSLFDFREKQITPPVQFLHIANLNYVKDQDTLLRAFKIISDNVSSRLTVIGEGVLEESIKALATELELADKVQFKGLMPYEELPNQYKVADLLLHTSLSEGQSEVVTEAMSCGVVVCGTRVGLMHDLPTCCISVPVEEYEALAKEVLKLLNEPERIKKIREDAHTWALSHSTEWTTYELGIVYRHLIEA